VTLPNGPADRPPTLPAPPKPSRVSPGVVITGCLVLVGLVVGAIVATRRSIDDAPATRAALIPAGWTNQTVRDAGFRIAFPPQWRAITGLDDDALDALRTDNPELAEVVEQQLGGASLSDLVRLFAVDGQSPGAPEFVTNANVIVAALPGRISLSDYLDANLDQLERLPGASVQEVERGVDLNGTPAGIFRVEYPLNTPTGAVQVSLTQFAAVRGTRSYVLTLTTTADQESRYQDVFERIGATFQLL
jgi:hypothetical protein